MAEIQQEKNIHAVELDMLEHTPDISALQKGAPTWLVKVLKIQKYQLVLT